MDIFTCILRNDARGVQNFLKRDLNDPNERNDRGMTGLHLCAMYGYVEIAGLLLEFGADLSLKDYESGYTPLHRAFYHGQYKVAWLFIRSGAVLDTGADEFCSTLPLKSLPKSDSIHVDCRDREGLSPFAMLSTILSTGNSKKPLQTEYNVFSFGKADYQLGVALPKSSSIVIHPKRIHTLANESIIQISANKHHSLALASDGKVFSWGHGKNGRLGHGTDSVQLEPRAILGLKKIVVFVSAGLNHSLALTDCGEVFSWGSDRCGQLGLGLSNSDSGVVLEPRKIEHLRKVRVMGVSAGEYHSVCSTFDGEVYCWGSNKVGQLGLKPSDSTSSQSGCPMVSFPKKVAIRSKLSKNTVLQVVAAYSSTMVLMKSLESIETSITGRENEVYQWGNGCYSPSKVKFPVLPSKDFSGLSVIMCTTTVNIVSISAGKNHSVAVSDIGHVYTWGLGFDQLGHTGSGSHYSPPRLVDALLPERGGGKIIFAEATGNRTCTISDKGDLYVWGATNDQGVLGHTSGGNYQPLPKRVGGVKRAVMVAAGEDFTIVLTKCLLPTLPLEEFYLNCIEIPELTNIDQEDPNSDDEFEQHGHCEQQDTGSSSRTELTLNIEIPTLKQLCERRLAQLVDTKYAPMFFAISETFDAPGLRAYCDKYISMNLDAIITQSKPNDLDILIQNCDRCCDVSCNLGREESYYKRNRGYSQENVMSGISNLKQPLRSRSYSIDNSDGESAIDTGFCTLKINDDCRSTENSRSRDLNSTQSVGRLIKAVKKKLNSIDELITKNNLTKEQMEKIDKKTSLQSELSRLELIYNRLKREEEIVELAKTARSKVECSPMPSKQPMIPSFEDFVSTAILADSKSKSTPISMDLTSLEKCPQVQSAISASSSSNVDEEAIRVSEKALKSKRAWILPQPVTAKMESSSSESTPSKPKTSTSVKIPLSAVGVNGQTVLSPLKSLPTSDVSRTTSQPVKLPASPSIPCQKSASTPQRPAPSSQQSTPGVNLSDFFTVKSESPSLSKPKASSFKWGSTKTSEAEADKSEANNHVSSLWSDKSVSSNLSSNPATLSGISLSHSSSSLLDIQRQEEKIKQMSTVNSYGSNNPWYVERRPRAPSMDEVIKAEEASRQEAERQRREELELEDALKLIAEAEKKEQQRLKKKSVSKQRNNRTRQISDA